MANKLGIYILFLNFQVNSEMKSENNNPWFESWFNILLHTQSIECAIVCATVDSQCLEYLGYITLGTASLKNDAFIFSSEGASSMSFVKNWASDQK